MIGVENAEELSMVREKCRDVVVAAMDLNGLFRRLSSSIRYAYHIVPRVVQIVVIVQNDCPTAGVFVAFVFPRRFAVFGEHEYVCVQQFCRRPEDHVIENSRHVREHGN